MTATCELGQKILDDLAESSEPPLKGSYRWMSGDQIDRFERRIRRNRLRSSDDGGELLSFPRLPQGNLSGAEQAASRATVAEQKIMAREDRRASWLFTIESVARRLSRVSRHTASFAVWVGIAVLVGRVVIDPTLVSWLKGVLATVLGNALESGFGVAVSLIVAASLFRREIARLLWRPKDTRDE